MTTSRLVTLLTDFGTSDGYVGAVKGVILSINPAARILDLTHDIAPQDVMAGALALAAAVPCFPEGSIHVAVVDPGVGTDRKPLLVKWRNRLLIGPDNGILSLAFSGSDPEAVYHLTNAELFLDRVSCTFHGRDVFAPVAAHLSRGVKPEQAGVRIGRWERIRFPLPRVEGGLVQGEVVHVDRFGNLITNIREEDLKLAHCHPRPLITIAGTPIPGLKQSYAEADPGTLLALVGSNGFLEISCNRGNAAGMLSVAGGEPVRVHKEIK